MNIVFMGTPDFAVPSLDALVNSGKHTVMAVYTQPDKPVGRKKIMTAPEVKVCACEYGIEVRQPDSLKGEQQSKLLSDLRPDVIVVIAYGKILPEAILKIPKYGCVNIHGSLLPKYRGAAPIQRAIIDGEKETGITSMLMDKGLDTGDILISRSTKINPDENAGELFDRLSIMGAEVLLETLDRLETGDITPIKQDNEKSNYASMLSKEECQIDWNLSAEEVHNKVRGMNPWPIALTMYNGKKLKIYKTKISNRSGMVNCVLSVKPPIIACGSGAVELVEVQLEGKNKMSAEDFFRGQRIKEGMVFE